MESDPEYGRDFNTLNSVISTPLIQGDYVYGVDGHGVLRCLEVATGRRVWETEALIGESTNWATAFFVRNGDRYFINTDTGDLVIATFSPEGYNEVSRTHLIDPTHPYVRRRMSGTAGGRQLVASRLREQAHRRPERPGDRAFVPREGGMSETDLSRDFARSHRACHGSEPATLGCTEPEALARLERVLAAHTREMTAFGAFARAGDNRLVVVPGDHDAALLFSSVGMRAVEAFDAPVRPG